MFIIEINEGPETLDDIKRICKRLIEHRELISLMSEEMEKELNEALSVILKPTLSFSRNEKKRRAYWEKLIQDFESKDPTGTAYRFYREPRTQRLYFGTQEGFKTIQEFVDKELNPIAK